MAPKPGLLYVNSKITSPLLTVPAFTTWYEDIHIRDIFVTSGMKAAFRYESTTPTEVERPYLAVYPVRDVDFLQSDEFKSIPVHDGSLPGESKCIFDLADFDTRYYELLKKGEGDLKVPAQNLLSVAFDSSSVDDGKVLQESIPEGLKPVRSRVYKLQFARQNRKSEEENELDQPPRYLALHEFDELSAESLTKTKSSLGDQNATVASFRILKAFGEVEGGF